MRDTKGSFQEYITIWNHSINKFNAALSSGVLAADRVDSVRRNVFMLQLQNTIALYSNGNSKEEVRRSLLDAINAFENGFTFVNGYGQYNDMVWMISLGIVFDIEPDYFARITEIIKRDKVNDKLLNFLLNYKSDKWMSLNDNFIQPSPYTKLSDVIDEDKEESGIRLIKSYLVNTWYKGHSDAAWYNSHTRKQVNTYFGYWAWETAALVKAKGWNDEKLKDLDYYPYDAVH